MKIDHESWLPPDKHRYYRLPGTLVVHPYHVTAAFTMRLLNFLYVLKMKNQATITVPHVDSFAKRYCPYKK